MDVNIRPVWAEVNLDNIINRVWYIESYITIPMMIISKTFFDDIMRLPEVVSKRREYINELIEDGNYVHLLGLVDKPFRISYFLDIYDSLEGDKFIEAFSFVYSSSEYGFDSLLDDDVIELLIDYKDTNKIKDILKNNFNITDKMVTIYRGEADKSMSYRDGAMSWTLELKVANFFANRFSSSNPKVYKAKVNVDDILLYLDRESEVLVEPCNLVDVELI